MNKTYRLLKNLPGVPAGTVSVSSQRDYKFIGGHNYVFTSSEIELYSEWFEELNPFTIGQELVSIKTPDLVVLCTGPGLSEYFFSGVVIKPCVDHLKGQYSTHWDRSNFKPL